MFVWIFTRNMFSINHYEKEVQYFSLWLHYDNLWKISIYYTVTELWKPTLKYIDGCKSGKRFVTSGVPQGTIVGS